MYPGICRFMSLAKFEKFSAIFSSTFSALCFFPSPCQTLRTWILALWWLNHKSVRLLFSCPLFPLCHSDWMISVSLPSSSLIFFLSHFSSAWNPSSERFLFLLRLLYFFSSNISLWFFFLSLFHCWDSLFFNLFQEFLSWPVGACLWQLLENPCLNMATSVSSQCWHLLILFSHLS